MDKIKIAKTDLSVSSLCLGGCPLGGYGWGEVERSELIATVRTAYDNGINFFDTADTYGLGESERLIAEALGADRHNAVIATKFGVRVESGRTFYDNSRDYVIRAAEASLERLKRDYIDVYQVHYRDGVTPLCDVIETLELLREQGKIRYYGLSNVSKDDARELSALGSNPFVSFQNEYSLACRKNETDMLRFRDDFSMTPLTWGSLGQGILSGKYDKNCHFDKNDRRSREIYVNFHGDKLVKNLEIVEEMKKISATVGKPVSSVAIRWILDYLTGSVVIAGAKTRAQVMQNIEASDWKLSNDEINLLERISR